MAVELSRGYADGPSRRQVVLVALAVGTIWAMGLALPLGWRGPNPPTQLEYVAFVVFSVMLASLVAIAWVLVSLARPDSAIRALGWILTVGGVVAAVGNLGEDSLRIAGFENIYGIGLLATTVGIVGLPIALAARREAFLTGLSALTLVAFVSGAGHGPPIMPLIWFGFAGWVAVRGLPGSASSSAPARSS